MRPWPLIKAPPVWVVGQFAEGLEFRLQADRVNAELQTKIARYRRLGWCHIWVLAVGTTAATRGIGLRSEATARQARVLQHEIRTLLYKRAACAMASASCCGVH